MSLVQKGVDPPDHFDAVRNLQNIDIQQIEEFPEDKGLHCSEKPDPPSSDPPGCLHMTKLSDETMFPHDSHTEETLPSLALTSVSELSIDNASLRRVQFDSVEILESNDLSTKSTIDDFESIRGPVRKPLMRQVNAFEHVVLLDAGSNISQSGINENSSDHQRTLPRSALLALINEAQQNILDQSQQSAEEQNRSSHASSSRWESLYEPTPARWHTAPKTNRGGLRNLFRRKKKNSSTKSQEHLTSI